MLRASTASARQMALKKAASGISSRIIQKADCSVGGAITGGRGVPARLPADATRPEPVASWMPVRPMLTRFKSAVSHAGQHHRQELAQHDLGPARRADQQGLHRPPLLLAGAEVDRRVKGPGQRHHDQQEREEPAPDAAPDLLRGGHVLGLDLDRLGVALRLLVALQPAVDDALASSERAPP